MFADKGPNEWNEDRQTKFEIRFGQEAPGPTEKLPAYYVPAGSLGFSVVVFISLVTTKRRNIKKDKQLFIETLMYVSDFMLLTPSSRTS